MYREKTEQLLAFIENSPSSFHAVYNMKQELLENGFEELRESRTWELCAGGKYFVTRNDSSLIAFKIPSAEFAGFHIMASHSDSPCFKIKENAEMEVDKKYVKLNVERYGGMLCAPWFDRPLSVAGRVMVKDGNRIRTKLVDVDRDLLMIPNLAVHMNREANDGYKYNAQVDMLPLFGDETAKGAFGKIVAEAAGVEEAAVISKDLFLYNREKSSIWGANEEFVSARRLDDLQCAFCSLQGLLHAKETETAVPVHCVLDNEEVGSGTKQGAASTFLKDVLHRINSAMGRTEEQYLTALASSFMVSADNAHAVHPNHGDKTDPTNRPYINGGIVIKHSANQKYTTDAVSAAVMKMICEKAGVPVQTFVNRSDMAGGSTLGNISNTQVALNTVDIGLAQLAMHSPYETAGVKDTAYLIKMAETFFGSELHITEDGDYELR